MGVFSHLASCIGTAWKARDCVLPTIIDQLLPNFTSNYNVPQRCGTFRLASNRLTILNRPSPKISPLARTIIGVSDLPFQRRHHRLMRPPMVRASVNEGVLYMPAIVSNLFSGSENGTTYQQQPQYRQAQNQSTHTSILSPSSHFPTPELQWPPQISRQRQMPTL
jgi:hypothetical protein